jgi:hypothetical protein
MYVLYYASMLRCWHLVWILVRTDHPYFRVGSLRFKHTRYDRKYYYNNRRNGYLDESSFGGEKVKYQRTYVS